MAMVVGLLVVGGGERSITVRDNFVFESNPDNTGVDNTGLLFIDFMHDRRQISFTSISSHKIKN